MADYSGKVMWPFGAAQVEKPAFAATIAIVVANHMAVIEPAILTGACTLSLTPTAEVRAGALVFVKQKATATETLTFAGSAKAPALVGAAGKTKVQALVFDGTFFVAQGAPVQID